MRWNASSVYFPSCSWISSTQKRVSLIISFFWRLDAPSWTYEALLSWSCVFCWKEEMMHIFFIKGPGPSIWNALPNAHIFWHLIIFGTIFQKFSELRIGKYCKSKYEKEPQWRKKHQLHLCHFAEKQIRKESKVKELILGALSKLLDTTNKFS